MSASQDHEDEQLNAFLSSIDAEMGVDFTQNFFDSLEDLETAKPFHSDVRSLDAETGVDLMQEYWDLLKDLERTRKFYSDVRSQHIVCAVVSVGSAESGGSQCPLF
jgi:hypothetical protein